MIRRIIILLKKEAEVNMHYGEQMQSPWMYNEPCRRRKGTVFELPNDIEDRQKGIAFLTRENLDMLDVWYDTLSLKTALHTCELERSYLCFDCFPTRKMKNFKIHHIMVQVVYLCHETVYFST